MREKREEWDKEGYSLFHTLWEMPCTIEGHTFRNAHSYVDFCIEHISLAKGMEFIDSIPDSNKVPKKADLAPETPDFGAI